MLEGLKRLFGSKHERDVKTIRPLVEQINAHFQEYENLSDEELRAKTAEFRARIKEGIGEIEGRITAVRERLAEGLEGNERVTQMRHPG
jgi:preprotein translocase subunit SecA